MARLLLLSVKDNDAAEAIIKLVLQSDDVHKEGWGDHVAELGTLISAYSKLEWVVARPMNYCKCGPGVHKNRQMGWTKTRHFGWWVHTKCNRVSKGVMQKFVTNMLNGSNDLLPEYRAALEPPAEVRNEVEGVPPQPAVAPAGAQEESPQGGSSTAERNGNA